MQAPPSRSWPTPRPRPRARWGSACEPARSESCDAPIRVVVGSRFQQRRDEFRGVEHAEILALLADADESNGNAQLLRDGEHDAAFGRPVEFGDDQAGYPYAFVKLLGLRDGVLSDGAVEHQQHFMRRRGVESSEHPLDLLELLHEMRLSVQ